MSAPVLITGAGPVGMVLACELLQQGLAVRIIDRIESPELDDPHSRAILLVPRALELLRRIGVSERLAEAGHRVPAIGYYAEGHRLGTARLAGLDDTPYPFMLALPQRETERVVRQRLHELGGVIERGVSLEVLDATPAGLEVGLRHPDGHIERMAPDWLVGADGAASTTRRLLGMELAGDPTDVTYAIADAPIDGPVPTDAQYYYSRLGILAVIPMGGGLYRVAATVAHRRDGSDPAWRSLLQELVDTRARAPLTVGEPTYARLVRPRCGRAEAFRRGRCFLAGDAAHVITPAGGQGMNLGIQDAVNLGWKLGGVLRGTLPEDILGTYHADRHPAAARTSATTALVVRLAMQRGRSRRAVRNAAFWAADRAGLVQRVLTPLLSQLDVDYGAPSERPIRFRTRRPHPGLRVPLFPPPGAGPGAAGNPSLARDGYTVACWPGRKAPGNWDEACGTVARQLPDGVGFVDLAGLPAASAGGMRRAFGGSPLIAVVRPDGHLGHVAGLENPDDTLSFLEVQRGPPHPPSRRRQPADTPTR